ncbi:hypothetical protein [Brevundimonas sp.]|uniref:hypothetical protein n=1 Tax=Brevundimonas sp. TaxID=1871086 RepID=UPI00391AC027
MLIPALVLSMLITPPAETIPGGAVDSSPPERVSAEADDAPTVNHRNEPVVCQERARTGSIMNRRQCRTEHAARRQARDSQAYMRDVTAGGAHRELPLEVIHGVPEF